jgi:sugar (pentulose or hexulose) kinase
MNEGGNLYEWLTNLFEFNDPKMVDESIAKMTPDSHQLTFLPFLTGERSPGWADHRDPLYRDSH